MAFIGNTNTTQGFTPAIDYFSGNASTTAFTLSRPVASVAQVQVVVNNVAQNPSSAYTVNSNTITFTSAPSSGTNNIYVYYTSPITQVIAPSQGTVNTTSLGTITNIASGSSNLTLQTGASNTTAMTVDTSQNVGIGTTSPAKLLHLSTASTGPTLRFENRNTTVVNNDIYGTQEFFGNDSSPSANGVRAKVEAYSTGTTGGAAVRIATASGGSTTLTTGLTVNGSTVTLSNLNATTATIQNTVTVSQNIAYGGFVSMTNADTQVDVDLTTIFTVGLSQFTLLKCSVSGQYIDSFASPTFAGSARLFKEWNQGISYNSTTYAIVGASLIGTGYTSDATNFTLGAFNAGKALVVVSATQVLLRMQNRTTPAAGSLTYYSYYVEALTTP